MSVFDIPWAHLFLLSRRKPETFVCHRSNVTQMRQICDFIYINKLCLANVSKRTFLFLWKINKNVCPKWWIGNRRDTWVMHMDGQIGWSNKIWTTFRYMNMTESIKSVQIRIKVKRRKDTEMKGSIQSQTNDMPWMRLNWIDSIIIWFICLY